MNAKRSSQPTRRYGLSLASYTINIDKAYVFCYNVNSFEKINIQTKYKYKTKLFSSKPKTKTIKNT